MAWFLAEVERFLERAIEAPTRRLFRARLQPVELARALGRAMAAESQVGAHGLQVPNHYRVALHPDDFHRFAAWREALEDELVAYVEQRARDRDWHIPGRARVEVLADAAVPGGRPVVIATTIDAPPASADGERQGGSRVADGTAVMEQAVAPPARAPVALLDLPDGGSVALARTVVRLGRALDNHVAIEHESVSRHHAEIRRAGTEYTLVDLGSTNGTRVEGELVQRRVLRSGETIHVGAVPLRFSIRG